MADVVEDSAHTHFAAFSPDGNYILCTDLGLDTEFVYDSELNEISKENVPSGSGSRHLVFSENGKYVYCVNSGRLFGKPEDCAGMVSLLCSDEGRYITGQSIYVDGGKSVQ